MTNARMEYENLRKRIEHEINCASMENASDTPDFILAEYLTDCLEAFDKATKARDKWHGHNPWPKNDEPVEAPSSTAQP